MEYLKNGWKTVVGTEKSATNEQPDVSETVGKLVERVIMSTLLEDRRDACRALKSLSKTFRVQVGALAMNALFTVLQNDSSDSEIVTYCLETLNNIIGNDDDLNVNNSDLNIQFTEIFIKHKDNVKLIIDLLPEIDFKIRWLSIKLLYGLVRNKLRDCQDCILTHPMGISRIMDLLLDTREVIRNDVLLLLVCLTKNNSNIQKIVAFENAFDRILEIISNEGYSDGGVVVEDCLSILFNLLKMNTSNQNFFKEGSYIQRLLPLLDISFDDSWNPQKVNNLLLMFKVIRCLVSPSNPHQVTSSCQKVMNKCGVLQNLCTILLSNGIPAEILTETINCVAEVIRGNQANQDYFSRVNAPIEPERPVIVILLMSMVNEKQPFELKCSVLYCFQSFLYKNQLGQAQVVETLLPTTSEVSEITAGQLLCGGFFSNDALSNWLVAVALSYTLINNVTQKEQLLRVQLATDPDSPPTSLLSYCSSLLQRGGHFQRRISLLMLLTTWLSNSSVCVSNFLSIPTNIPYLTSQIGLVESDPFELLIQGLSAFLLGICICFNDNSVLSFTKHDLVQLITNRIGIDIFIDKLSLISKNEKYSQALQMPYLSYLKADDVAFDYEFCNFFKIHEGSILKTIQSSSNNSNNEPESNMTNEDHKLLIQYKELIREQDQQLISLRKQLTLFQNENESLKCQLQEQHSIVQQLRDQNSLLKVQKSVYDPSSNIYSSSQQSFANNHNLTLNSSSYTNFSTPVPQQLPDAMAMNTCTQMYSNTNYLTGNDTNQMNIQTNFNNSTVQNTDIDSSKNNSINNLELNNMINQFDSLKMPDNCAETTVSNPIHNVYGAMNSNETNNPAQLDYLFNENRRLQSIIDQYKLWEQSVYAYQAQQSEINSNVDLSNSSNNGNVVQSTLTESQPVGQEQQQYNDQPPIQQNNLEEVDKLKSELNDFKKEQDELLILLADQNLKMQKYEKKLKEIGYNVNDDEENYKNDDNDGGHCQSSTVSCEQPSQLTGHTLPIQGFPSQETPQLPYATGSTTEQNLEYNYH